jgi:hypothetical protein
MVRKIVGKIIERSMILAGMYRETVGRDSDGRPRE